MGLTNFPNGITSMGVPILGGIDGVMAFKKVYFVNGGGGSGQLGSDDNNGLSMDQPFLTVQKALNTVVDGDTVLVWGGAGNSYDEELTTGQHTTASNMAAGKGRYCQLIGIRPTNWTYDSPQLYNISGSTATLFIRSPGWRVSGFRVVGDSGSPVCIKTQMAQAGATNATNWAPGFTIDNVVFYGAVGSTKGLQIKANGDSRVLHCVFEQFNSDSLPCIGDEGGEFTFPRVDIRYNSFVNNIANIDSGLQVSAITDNVIGFNKSNTMTRGIDLRSGGAGNVVYRNQLDGTYKTFTNSGFYEAAGASDNWAGNWSDDLTAASVDAATGVTWKQPAA